MRDSTRVFHFQAGGDEMGVIVGVVDGPGATVGAELGLRLTRWRIWRATPTAAIAPTMVMSFCVENRFADPCAWLPTDRFVVALPVLFTVSPV